MTLKEDSKKSLTTQLCEFLIQAIRDAFTVQASTPIEIKKIEAIQPNELPNIALVSSIGVKSSKGQGLIALFFPQRTFLAIVNRMLGENYDAITDANADAAGELLNIIYASARVKLNGEGYDFMPAIPTVVKGTSLMHGGSPLIVRISCESELGPFFLEFNVKS